MLIVHWIASWKRRCGFSPSGPRPRSRRSARPAASIVALEQRQLLSSNPALVADVNPGSPGSNPEAGIAYDGYYFFAAHSNDQRGLWKTDGTAAGTSLVQTLAESYPISYIVVNGQLFFHSDGLGPQSLYVLSGAGGTPQDLGQYDFREWAALGNELVFPNAIAGGYQGADLYKTNGGSPINLGIHGSDGLGHFQSANGLLYFDGEGGLWSTDGQPGNAAKVGDGSGSPRAVLNGQLYVVGGASDATQEIFRLNPANNTLIQITSSNSTTHFSVVHDGLFDVVGSRIYFDGYDDAHGIELWYTNGSVGDKHFVKDIHPGAFPNNVDISSWVVLGDKLLFVANDGTTSNGLWVTGSGASGAQRIDPGFTGPATVFSVANGRAWFAGTMPDTGTELWTSDGTKNGTYEVADLYPGNGSSITNADVGGALGNLLFIAASAPPHLDLGRELWGVDTTHVSRSPALGAFGGDVTYTENAASLPLTSTATIGDLDSPNFDGGQLTITLTANAEATDRLGIRTAGSISVNTPTSEVLYSGTTIGTFSGGVGIAPLVVNLNANATPAITQALLRAITFQSVSENPSALSRSVQVQLTDGDGGGGILSTLAKSINVTPVNDKPVLAALGGTPTYVENAAALLVSVSATVADVDSPNFDGGALTVTLTANAESTDRLAIRNGGTITTDAGSGTVYYSGTPFGTFSGGDGSTPLVVNLNAAATPAISQALLRAITFQAVSENPSPLTRTVSIQLTDGDGGTSNAYAKSINVTPVNDKPVIASFGGARSYVENAAPLPVTTTAAVADVDSPDFNGGTLTVTLTVNAEATDQLAIPNAGGFAVNAGTGEVQYNGTTIGTVGGGNGSTPLVANLNGNVTPAIAQALLRAITFTADSENPSALPRSLTVQLADGDGGTSTAMTKQINVTPVNDKSAIDSFGGDVSYTGGGAPVALTTTALVSDVDSPDFNGGKLVVKYTAGGQSSDRLEIASVGNISVNSATSEVSYGGTVIGTFTGGSGLTALTINFNSAATPARVQELLRAITYRNTLSSPPTAPRTVQVQLFDGDGGVSLAVAKQINVSAPTPRPSFADLDAAFAAYAAG